MASITQCGSFSCATGVRAAAGTSYREAAPATLDYGRVLGVRPNASKREVKSAYRKLALQFHPDVCKEEECDVSFVEVNRAYESLMAMNPQSPSSYGESGSSFTGFASASASSSSSASTQGEDPWADFVQSLERGTYEDLQVDYSSYYSNLKCYGSKARRSKSSYPGASSSQYYQGNW